MGRELYKRVGKFLVNIGKEDQDTIFKRKYGFLCFHLHSKPAVTSKLCYLHLHKKGRPGKIFKPKLFRLCNAYIFQKLSFQAQASNNVWVWERTPCGVWLCMLEVSALFLWVFFPKDGHHCCHLKVSCPGSPCGLWRKLGPPRRCLYLGPLHKYVTRWLV